MGRRLPATPNPGQSSSHFLSDQVLEQTGSAPEIKECTIDVRTLNDAPAPVPEGVYPPKVQSTAPHAMRIEETMETFFEQAIEEERTQPPKEAESLNETRRAGPPIHRLNTPRPFLRRVQRLGSTSGPMSAPTRRSPSRTCSSEAPELSSESDFPAPNFSRLIVKRGRRLADGTLPPRSSGPTSPPFSGAPVSEAPAPPSQAEDGPSNNHASTNPTSETNETPGRPPDPSSP